MFLLKASEMREADRYTIDTLGIPGLILMENAGIAVIRALDEAFSPDRIRRVIIFCGKGNNGGDGFVVARHLHLAGDEVEVVLLAEKKQLSGDAIINMLIADNLGIPIAEINDISGLEKMGLNLDGYDVIVDALLGTGIMKPLEGLYAYTVELINSSCAFVVSVDLPSGLPTDTGEILGAAVEADLTVTFAYPKVSHILPPAEEYCGEIVVADICIPPEAVKFDKGKRELITPESLEGLIPRRSRSCHKGAFGHLMVIAGSMGKLGAAAMAAHSATLSGAGLVTVAAPSSCVPAIHSKLTEEMALPLSDEGKGILLEKNVDEVLESLGKTTALVLGPGIGRSDGTVAFVKRLLAEIKLPIVIDADGLNALAGNTDLLKKLPGPVILTPHPGEFSCLTGIDVVSIQKDRMELACEYASKWGAYVILKGYRTVVATMEGDIYLCLTGNPGMAKGGSGDVLTGIIGGLLATGLSPVNAARLGVHIHGRAADMAAEFTHEVSLTAGDIMTTLPEAFDELYGGE